MLAIAVLARNGDWGSGGVEEEGKTLLQFLNKLFSTHSRINDKTSLLSPLPSSPTLLGRHGGQLTVNLE